MELKRIAENKDGIFGVLIYNDTAICATLENNDYVIPYGNYKCVRSYYHRGKYETFEIKVPGRTRILIHKGNYEEDTEGCLLVGESFETLYNGKRIILNSAKAFREFMEITRHTKEFILKIRDLT